MFIIDDVSSKLNQNKEKAKKKLSNVKKLRNENQIKMLVALLLISQIFLVLYPVNVNGGVVQNNDSNWTQILGGDWLVDFLKTSNEFEDEQNWKKSVRINTNRTIQRNCP